MPATVLDRWIPHPEGRLFAREWRPEGSPAADAAAPIVLLHDSLGCVELWRDFPAQLSQATGRRVIAYDRLGFGRSDARAEVLSPLGFIGEEATRYFPAVREHLGLERFVVGGHSVGGGMSIHIAARAGAACQALITLSAQVFTEERTLDGIRAAQLQFQDDAQVAKLARYHGDKARWVLQAWIGSWLHPDFATWTLRGVLPQVLCPVLSIHGDADEYGSVAHPSTIGELAGGPAEVEVRPGGGHLPHREQPDWVCERVARFL